MKIPNTPLSLPARTMLCFLAALAIFLSGEPCSFAHASQASPQKTSSPSPTQRGTHMTFKIVSEDDSSPISSYQDSEGKTWTQIEANGKYSIDVSAYSLPFNDVQYKVEPQGCIDISSVNHMPSENRTNPYALKLVNLRVGKCTITITPGQMGEGPYFYPDPTASRVLNIKVVKNIHTGDRQ